MVSNDFWVVFAMLLYFVAVLTIGFVYAKRSNSSTAEYFLGGRGVGPWLTALSAEASDMSGWLLMGLPGVAYFTGASDAMWTAIGLAIGTYLNWKFVAKRLRKYSVVAGDSITLPEFYSKRFHDRKNIVSTVAALIIMVFFCVYVGSCFVTCGKLFATLFGLDYATMMVLGAIIVFLYTLVGGYLSVVTTDFVQGVLMFFALATVFVGSVAWAGGVDNTVAFLQNIPGFLSGTQIAVPLVDDAGRQLVENGIAPVRRRGRVPAHHHRLDAGVGPRLLRHAAGARAFHGHPLGRRGEEVARHRGRMVRRVAGLRHLHRLGGPRHHPRRLRHAGSGRKRVHRAVPDDLAAVHVRRGGVGHLRGVDELLVLVLADRRLLGG